MDIFELTVPLKTNIQNANTQKMNKYEHFITDITTRDVSVHPFCNRHKRIYLTIKKSKSKETEQVLKTQC